MYSCMIHNLFDEYRFFPKYPEKELQVSKGLCWSAGVSRGWWTTLICAVYGLPEVDLHGECLMQFSPIPMSSVHRNTCPLGVTC